MFLSLLQLNCAFLCIFFGHFVAHVDLFHAYWVHFIHSSVWIPAVDHPYQHFQSDEVAHTVFTHKMHWLLLTECFSILSTQSTFYYKQHNTHWYSSIYPLMHTQWWINQVQYFQHVDWRSPGSGHWHVPTEAPCVLVGTCQNSIESKR